MAPVPPLGPGTPGNSRFTRKKYIGFGETFFTSISRSYGKLSLSRFLMPRNLRGWSSPRLIRYVLASLPDWFDDPATPASASNQRSPKIEARIRTYQRRLMLVFSICSSAMPCYLVIQRRFNHNVPL